MRARWVLIAWVLAGLVGSLAGASGSWRVEIGACSVCGEAPDPAADAVAAFEKALEKGPRGAEYRKALLNAREVLVAAEACNPATVDGGMLQGSAHLNDREKDLIGQRSANNDLIKQRLTGRYVIVLATDKFAQKAKEDHFTATFDLAYLVLKNIYGNDPIARSGNRFLIWPDPSKPGGHSCQGLALQIAVGRADNDNPDWFERYFHEMTHGFQYAHPAGCSMQGGFFEGWAEFSQAIVPDFLAPLGPPFAGRFDYYSKHFPASGKQEYLDTRLPVEEIVAYDPSSAVLMELTNTTKDSAGRPDWAPIRALLHNGLNEQPSVPWDLWPALFARDTMRFFGAAKARPILSKYRFPLDEASAQAVEMILKKETVPVFAQRRMLREWRGAGPIDNPGRLGPEWDPLDAQNMAIDAALLESGPAGQKLAWRTDLPVDEKGVVHFTDDRGAGPQFWYAATDIPADLHGPVTLYISSDDDCLLWVDGELVYMFRGGRAANADGPDVAYADITGPGHIVALVQNQGMPAGITVAVSKGGLLHEGFAQRMKSTDADERAAAVRYVATRRLSPFVTPVLITALDDPGPAVRTAAAWGLAGRRNDPRVVGALIEHLKTEKDNAVRSQLRDSLQELTFQGFVTPLQASQWWDRSRPAFADSCFVEAEDAYFLRRIQGGFFGNSAGAYGGQCVGRGWGADKNNWMIVALDSRGDGPKQLRIRYATPNDSTMHVRIRRGTSTVFDRASVQLKRTKDWNTWAWGSVDVPPMPAGRYYVDLAEPTGTPDVDVVGWCPLNN